MNRLFHCPAVRVWIGIVMVMNLASPRTNAALVPAHASNLVITEFVYDPAPPYTSESAAGFDDNNDFEFIELWNRSNDTLDLNGVAFTSGISFSFTNTLEAGHYLLVVRDRPAFEFRYGAGLPVAGEYTGRLANEGERVQLTDATEEPIQEFTYDELPPWPRTVVNGQAGYALELIAPETNPDPDDPTHWRVSYARGGTPGKSPDADGNGLIDAWEIEYFAMTGNDPNADPDEDGLTNEQEQFTRTDPLAFDTDQDGWGDGVETNTRLYVDSDHTGTDPNDPDTDHDGLLDGVETNTRQFKNAFDTGTDPLIWDTDGDTFPDGTEVNANKNPLDPESIPLFPRILSFSANPLQLVQGESTTLTWMTEETDAVYLVPDPGTEVEKNGNLTLSPAMTTTYSLIASNAYRSISLDVFVTVYPAAPPVIESFAAVPALADMLVDGGRTTLAWTVSGLVEHLALDQGIGPVSGAQAEVRPWIQQTLIATGTVWKYLDDGSAQGSGWSWPGFEDTTWAEGPAELGYGDGDESTVVNAAGAEGNSASILYFRKTFNIPTIDNLILLKLRVKRDDGLALYLNGQEILRDNLPAGPLFFDTPASATVTDSEEAFYQIFSLPPLFLQSGQNVMAAELHQAGGFDGDASFDLGLEAFRASPGTVTYTLTASNRFGEVSQTADLIVTNSGPPVIGSFTANPDQLLTGNMTQLSWSIQGAVDEVVLDPMPGRVTGNSAYVRPSGTSGDAVTYTLIARNLAGESRAQVTVYFLADAIELLDYHQVWKYDQSGIDRGTAWKEPDYDDADWPSGPGVLGWEQNGPAVPLLRTLLPLPFENNTLTTYFRTRFQLPMIHTNVVGLRLTHLMDDGGAVYLNGQEIHRLGLLPGADFFSPADRVINNIDFEGPFNLPATALVPGENVLAVELHQINFSTTDLVWGGQLELVIAPPLEPVIAVPPKDQIVSEGGQANFHVTVQGFVPILYQWRRNGENLIDATNAVLILENVTLDSEGDYDVIVSNVGGEGTSTTARLTVVPASAPPRLLSAEMGFLSNQVWVTFSDSLDVFSITDLAHYRMTDEHNVSLPVFEARLWNGTQLVLRTAPRSAGSLYTLQVQGIRDDSGSGIPMEAAEVPVHYQVTFVAMDANWNYDESGTDLGTPWKEPGYDDTTWPQGPGLLGFEEIPLPYPLQTVLTPPEFRGPVYYFRTRFTSPSDATTANLTLRYEIDDGAVFYLNGHELHRVRVPANQNFQTLATFASQDGLLEGPWPVSPDFLRKGINVLAVEVHQASIGSADVVMGAELVQTYPPNETIVRPRLHIQNDVGLIRLTWDQPGYVLEVAEHLEGPWQEVPTMTNVFQSLPGETPAFYRLRRVVGGN